MSSSSQLPTIPASPNPLSEIEDNDEDEDSTTDADEPLFESHGRKRRHSNEERQPQPPPSMHPHALAQPDRPQNEGSWYGDSMYSAMGPGSSGLGSWYFHQHQQGSSSAYGVSPGGGMMPNGGALPPHLAYWMYQNNGSGNMSDLTHQQSFGGPMMGGGGMLSPTGTGGAVDGNNDGRAVPSHEHGSNPPDLTHLLPPEDEYKVYSSRWIMLFYMSLLNLLSDWTCYSIAPIAILTIKAFGDVDPEKLVTVFLGANAVASAAEPAILGRLGLRRTVLFGGFLLMLGSIVKSGGFKTLLMSSTAAGSGGMTSEEILEEIMEEEKKDETWRLYLGFFLVGLSQPLYQCTPALLSASWFPENERTMATGVALNSNQLGIGCAFVFGTILVSTEEDIIPYFGLLSLISALAFIGAALQFDDAPPTPPSETARVIKGDLEIKIPKLPFIGRLGRQSSHVDEELKGEKVEAPAPASYDDSVEVTMAGIRDVEKEMQTSPLVAAPSPAPTDKAVGEEEPSHKKQKSGEDMPLVPAPLQAQPNHPLQSPGGFSPPPPPYPNPYAYMPPPGYYPSYPPSSMGYSTTAPGFYHGYDQQGHYHNDLLDEYAPFAGDDEGVEPIMTQLDHKLDIDIRDDQLIQQVKACFRRKGFAHCVVAFTTSGIIINTLSTYMDYLVTLNGAGPEYVGIVGGTFQMLIMCSSLVVGAWTDHSRKYYFVILAMLVFGAFALAVCNVNLDADAGGDLRLTLLVVAVLAGPLQPISTELG